MKCICENCGKEIDYVLINTFDWDGNDRDYIAHLEDLGDGVYGISTTHNWTGDGLDDEDAIDTIVCPKCKKFPFKCKEIGKQEIVHLTLWSKRYQIDKIN